MQFQANDIASVDAIISNYKHHPNINQIRKKCSNPKIYSFPEAKNEEINILIECLNPKKATGTDGISHKIIKLSADIFDTHLTNITNTNLECPCFSENAKIASVKPIYDITGTLDLEFFARTELIKAETSLAHFRSLIITWFGKECFCNLRKHMRTFNSINY